MNKKSNKSLPRNAHRSAKACDNVPNGGAKSVPSHIHRELKVEADVKIICADDRHLLDLICRLCARSITDEVLLYFYLPMLQKLEPTAC